MRLRTWTAKLTSDVRPYASASRRRSPVSSARSPMHLFYTGPHAQCWSCVRSTPSSKCHVSPGAWPPAPPSLGKRSAELAAPVADAFAGDHCGTLSQDQRDIARAQAEEVIQPYRVADDLNRGAMAAIQVWLRGHATNFTYPSSTRHSRLTCQCRCGSCRLPERQVACSYRP